MQTDWKRRCTELQNQLEQERTQRHNDKVLPALRCLVEVIELTEDKDVIAGIAISIRALGCSVEFNDGGELQTIALQGSNPNVGPLKLYERR